jgi:hypothetical protein
MASAAASIASHTARSGVRPAIPYACSGIGEKVGVCRDCSGSREQLPHGSGGITPASELLGYIGGGFGQPGYRAWPFRVGNTNTGIRLDKRIRHSVSGPAHAPWANSDGMQAGTVLPGGPIRILEGFGESIAYQGKNPINRRRSTGAVGFYPKDIARPSAE